MRQCVDVKRGTSVRCGSLGVWGDIGGLRRWLRLTTRNKQRQQRKRLSLSPKKKPALPGAAARDGVRLPALRLGSGSTATRVSLTQKRQDTQRRS